MIEKIKDQYRHIKKVIESCETMDQLKYADKWSNNVLKRFDASKNIQIQILYQVYKMSLEQLVQQKKQKIYKTAKNS